MTKLEPLAGERQKGESQKAIQACNDFLRMGPGRSVADLWRRYAKGDKNIHPTQSYPTLRNWSSRYSWIDRGGEYDVELERQKNALRQEVMQSGLALDYERTSELKRLAHFLIEQLYEQGKDGDYHNVWLPDVKQIGSGNKIERIDIERFNAAIISELRGVLDDLAKETGGRSRKHEITGAEGGPVNIELTIDRLANQLQGLTDAELTRFIQTVSNSGESGNTQDTAAHQGPTL